MANEDEWGSLAESVRKLYFNLYINDIAVSIFSSQK